MTLGQLHEKQKRHVDRCAAFCWLSFVGDELTSCQVLLNGVHRVYSAAGRRRYVRGLDLVVLVNEQDLVSQVVWVIRVMPISFQPMISIQFN